MAIYFICKLCFKDTKLGYLTLLLPGVTRVKGKSNYCDIVHESLNLLHDNAIQRAKARFLLQTTKHDGGIQANNG